MRSRTDIIEELEAAKDMGMRPGTSNSDINVFAEPVQLPYGVVARAISEIRRLREKVALQRGQGEIIS